ncbi:MAG: extracellular solute-binding protein, partial [Clostridia bacterium]|nr:extracellular solute-binding protein [Clostridia bacterium]
MKKFNKITALVLGSLTAVSAFSFVGCKKGDSDTEIEIAYWNSGLGDKYISKVVDAFKAEYPEYDVVLDSRGVGTVIATTLNKGADYNTYDLYITNEPDAIDRPYMEPLNDILTQSAKGESVTIAQKYNPTVLENLKANDDNYYNLSYYGGIIGITYDATIIDGVKYQLPRTTNELVRLAAALYADTQTPVPFIHFKGEKGGYWGNIYETWRAQYDGVENFYKFFEADYLADCTTDEAKISAFTTNMSKKDSRYKVMELLNRLLNYNYCYNGSNSLEFDEAQTLYLSGQACMMVNGAWMEKEMQKTDGKVGAYKTMKTPVFSAITETFEGADKDMDDSTLCEIIDLVDAGTAYSATAYPCTEATYNRVKEARNLIPSNA